MKEFRELVLAIEEAADAKVLSSTVVPLMGSTEEVPAYVAHMEMDGNEYVLTLSPSKAGPMRARDMLQEEGEDLALGMRVTVTDGRGGVVEKHVGAGMWEVTLDGGEGFMTVRRGEARAETKEDTKARDAGVTGSKRGPEARR